MVLTGQRAIASPNGADASDNDEGDASPSAVAGVSLDAAPIAELGWDSLASE